jgi:hypothetical protein
MAKFNVKKHDKVLSNTLEEVQAGVFDNAKALESEVAELVSQGLPVEALRPQINQAFGRHAESVRASANSLRDVSTDLLDQSSLPVEPADYVAESALLQSSQDELANTVASASEDVIKTAVLATVAGVTTAALVNQVRGRISGVHMDSNDPEVKKLQRKLRKATGQKHNDLVAQIKRKLPGDVNTAAALATLLSTKAESVVGSFNGAFAKSRAKRQKIERFEYAGGLMATSRPFCRSMLGLQMTEEEIQNIWNGESWAGKEPGDAFVVRGGYNCQHYWVPVENFEEE